MIEIRLDPVMHIYQDAKGQIYPSVTTIIRAAGVMRDGWFTPESAARGTAVHDAVRLDMDGLLDESSMDDIRGYVYAHRRFMKESDFQPLTIEQTVCHEAYHFAGRLDATGLLNGKFCLVDWKSGSVAPWVGMQLAAYQACLPNTRFYRRFAVELRENGTYKMHEYTSPADWAAFHAAVTLYHWRQNHGC